MKIRHFVNVCELMCTQMMQEIICAVGLHNAKAGYPFKGGTFEYLASASVIGAFISGRSLFYSAMAPFVQHIVSQSATRQIYRLNMVCGFQPTSQQFSENKISKSKCM